MLIAQISDLHVMPAGELAYGRYDTAATLARCVDSLLRLRPLPALVLATGDLVEHGTAGEYRRLRGLLAPLPMPVYLIPGNHDARETLRLEFGDHAYLGRAGTKVGYRVTGNEVCLIALDTVVPEEDGGALDPAQLDWLAAQLAAGPHTPTLVLMHHPPFTSGICRLDEIALDAASAGRLGRIIERHPQVERIVCGHTHRAIQARWHGTMVSVCPSTAFQYGIDLRPHAGAVPTAEPPAYQLHYWNGTGLVTHTVTLA
ncbi:MAG: phosphodiesterase [Burkholderiales bacterium]